MPIPFGGNVPKLLAAVASAIALGGVLILVGARMAEIPGVRYAKACLVAVAGYAASALGIGIAIILARAIPGTPLFATIMQGVLFVCIALLVTFRVTLGIGVVKAIVLLVCMGAAAMATSVVLTVIRPFG